jgi:endoglucanase
MKPLHMFTPKRASSLGVVSSLCALAFGTAAPAQTVPPGDLPFGVYDPNGDFSELEGVSIEHLFLPWEDVLLPSLFEAENYAKERGRTLLVTIEPWTWSRDDRHSPTVLREGIQNGTYDATMQNVCSALGQLDIPMTIRWAQEMEDPSGQFIWSN